MIKYYSSTFYLLLSLFSSFYAQNVGINATGATAHQSAALDVSSTNAGFLPPRMNTVQRDAIASPSAGLMLYNTDNNCLQFFDGIAWSSCLVSAANALICGSSTINGVYSEGIALNASNTISIDVNISIPGNYTISTNTQNGYSFTATGTFATTGTQTITLTGNGTPTASQTDNFIVTLSGSIYTCKLSIQVGVLPKNCLAYLNKGYTTDGIYAIDSDGAGGNAPYNCYCDMTTAGGGWTLVFNHNTAGGYWANQTEADFFNVGSPGLATNKYSILMKIDELKSAPEYEFRINFPSLNVSNHWKQSFDPRSGGSTISPVAGYQAINIGSSANLWGGLERSSATTFLDGSVNHPNWYYSVGSSAPWNGGIPSYSPVTDKVQLFIR